MKDLDFAKEMLGKKRSLRFHLTGNFYPPLPEYVMDAFVEVFTEYWNGELEADDLDEALARRAWYTGGIGKYDFWQFLYEEDLEQHRDLGGT